MANGANVKAVQRMLCGSPEIVEGSLCRCSVEGGVLVVDRGLACCGAVAALVVVEAVAPVDHSRPRGRGGVEVVPGQHLPLQAGEERLGRGVVPCRQLLPIPMVVSGLSG